jgi:hypothetical protein
MVDIKESEGGNYQEDKEKDYLEGHFTSFI